MCQSASQQRIFYFDTTKNNNKYLGEKTYGSELSVSAPVEIQLPGDSLLNEVL